MDRSTASSCFSMKRLRCLLPCPSSTLAPASSNSAPPWINFPCVCGNPASPKLDFLLNRTTETCHPDRQAAVFRSLRPRDLLLNSVFRVNSAAVPHSRPPTDNCELSPVNYSSHGQADRHPRGERSARSPAPH